MSFQLRNFLFSLLLFFSWPLWAKILDDRGQVLSDVVAIFEQLQPLMTEQQQALLRSPTLEHLNCVAQQVFLRPAGLERKDIQQLDSRFRPYATSRLASCFKAIGDSGPIIPLRKQYNYILFNGSTVQNMRARLAGLIELIESGALHISDSTQLVLLTGERDLFETEDRKVLLDTAPLTQDPSWYPTQPWPKTEADALVWIFQQTQLPYALRHINKIFIRAPKNSKVDKAGNITYVRPTTQDTLKAWIQQSNPKPGTCLSISSQPYVYYQAVTMRSCLANLKLNGFEIEAAGYDQMKPGEFDKDLPIYLDNLARTIYSEVQLATIQRKGNR